MGLFLPTTGGPQAGEFAPVILTTTTQNLQVFLAGAKALNDCPIVIDYVDFTATATTPGMTPVNTNGVTTTDILAAPAASTQRKVNSINLYNADSASAVVTIQINDNSTLYPVLSAVTVVAGATLQYTDRDGWSVIIGGATRLSLPNNVQEFRANGTWTNPGGYRFALVECVGGGGGGGGAQFNCPNASYGGGGGGGKRTRVLFNAGQLPTTVSITVGAGGTGGVGATAGVTGGTSSFGTYLYAYGGGGGGHSYSSTAGGGGGGGTSAGTTSLGGSAQAGTISTTAYPDDRGASGPSQGSYLGGGSGGSPSSTANGGYSFFSAGGGAGYSTSGVLGGGAGSTTTAPIPPITDILGCGTGGCGVVLNAAYAGGFPGGGGCGIYDNSFTPGNGTAGGAGVVRVWCW